MEYRIWITGFVMLKAISHETMARRDSLAGLIRLRSSAASRVGAVVLSPGIEFDDGPIHDSQLRLVALLAFREAASTRRLKPTRSSGKWTYETSR